MAKAFKNHTLKEYIKVLSQRTPVPGGGSASALAGSLGAALLSMVTQYSIGKSKDPVLEKQLKESLKKSDAISKSLLELVDLDAQAYLKVVKVRKKSKAQYAKAQKQAAQIPLKVSALCYQAVELAPLLANKGNKYLLSDVEVAVELLLSAFNGALALQKS